MSLSGIVHASAIPISILVLLSQQDLISLENALPVIMGANIGTTITALLAGTVATMSGKRSAVSHLIFKCIGVVVCFIFMPYFTDILKNLSSSTSQQIALAHFLFNLLIVFIFIFLLRPFTGLMKKLLPGDDEALPIWPEFLDEKDLSNAKKAVDNVQKELKREIILVQKMFLKSYKYDQFLSEGREKRHFVYRDGG